MKNFKIILIWASILGSIRLLVAVCTGELFISKVPVEGSISILIESIENPKLRPVAFEALKRAQKHIDENIRLKVRKIIEKISITDSDISSDPGFFLMISGVTHGEILKKEYYAKTVSPEKNDSSSTILIIIICSFLLLLSILLWLRWRSSFNKKQRNLIIGTIFLILFLNICIISISYRNNHQGYKKLPQEIAQIKSSPDQERLLFLAVQEAGRVKDTELLEPLFYILRDPNNSYPAKLREYAAKAIGEIGSVKGLAVLNQTAFSQDMGIREASIRAIGNILAQYK